MAARAQESDEEHGRAACWCCGAWQPPRRLVHLGKHPEVVVCLRCAHSLSKRARQIEDQDRTGLSVQVRDRMRQLREVVIRQGWHHHKIVGRPLRWLGRFTP